MHQYYSNGKLKPINRALIEQILEILSHSTLSKLDSVNIDVCCDIPIAKPNIQNLTQDFKLNYYFDSKYINIPNLLAIDKVIVYNKASKNGLESPLYRVEATMTIHNLKDPYIPLDDVYSYVIVPITSINRDLIQAS